MISRTHRIIVITPVYEDVAASSRLFRELGELFGADIFVVAVDDGSIRETLPIEALKHAGVAGVVLKLRRNVGHQRAIAIGLSYTAAQMCDNQRAVIMDSDGEDLPSSIAGLVNALESEEYDIAVAARGSRVATLRFRLFYFLYKHIFRLLTGRSLGFGNFMALKAVAVRRLASMHELAIHVAGAVLASNLRTGFFPIDRGPRYAGQSKMHFIGLALHGFKAVMIFAEDVLVRTGIAAMLIASLSVVSIIAAIVLKTIGFATPGWFSVALGILVLVLLQTAALALMTLMLTGVLRSGTVTSSVSYQEFVDRILSTKS